MNMMGGNENETEDEMIMGGMMDGWSGNMSAMPFKMGVLAMPLMCTTPSDIISGIFGAELDNDQYLKYLIFHVRILDCYF
jgi:hypothetical protein